MHIFNQKSKKKILRWPDFLRFVSHNRHRKRLDEAHLALQELENAVNKRNMELQARLHANDALYSTLLALPNSWAHQARTSQIKPIDCSEIDELCLFVTHAPHCTLKAHVIDHIHALAAQQIKVILIVNTDLAPDLILIPESLHATLYGCMVRENLGFDFAAWSHAFSLIDTHRVRQRLYFVNDSIVGPLDHSTFASMIQRIRSCNADVVGLTENAMPKWHLQSFFLAFNKRAMSSDALLNLMKFTLNLPTKQHVIDIYETQISEVFLHSGLQCRSAFTYLGAGSPEPDDTHARWSELIKNGFPFIKASVLATVRSESIALQFIPEKYRNIAGPSDQANNITGETT